MKPTWLYTAAGQWRRVYDADEVERHLQAIELTGHWTTPLIDEWAAAFTAVAKTSKED